MRRMLLLAALLFGIATFGSYAQKHKIVRPEPTPAATTVKKPTGLVAVDLGLSVKWASCNLGASRPEQNGKYYQFGQGDADAAKLGKGWRVPTDEEIKELGRCKRKWTKVNGHRGYKITGPNGNSIFLPAAGTRRDGKLCFVGSDGFYWSSTPSYGQPPALYFYSRDWCDICNDSKSNGLTVRPVMSK